MPQSNTAPLPATSIPTPKRTFAPNQAYCIDNLKGMAQMPPKSVQLLIADPPYYKVKGEFDFVWRSFEEYLDFMEQQAKAYKRILADNGTLFVYGHAKRIAYIQVIFDRYFKLENSLVWEKAEKDGMFGSTGQTQLRTFPNSTERILMYSNGIEPEEYDQTGWEKVKKDIANFQPLRQYFKELQGYIGLNLKKINTHLGHRKAEHAFYWGSTQWDLPTTSTYQELIEVFGINHFKGFREYESLRREYESLRREYESLRRYFDNVTQSTEVLKFRFLPSDYDHPTVKPESLTRALILTCSRPNDLVFAPFAGSGTECAMAAKEGRRFLGFDIEQKYVDMTNQRAKPYLRQTKLFY